MPEMSEMPGTEPQVGFLHPGKMGSAMASTLQVGEAHWTGDRSPASAARAEAAAMTATPLPQMAASADVIISICPPAAAIETSQSLADLGYSGIYVDANAIAPTTAVEISTRFERFVDASVVGPPPVGGRTARLYLSGPEAPTIAALWEGSALEPRIVGEAAGGASAVKMGYAGFTKGLAALVLDIHAYAEAEDVSDALLREFSESQPAFGPVSAQAHGPVIGKAWRFAGEMDEIASSYAANGLPDGFWVAAADIYRRLSEFRDADPSPSADVITAALQTQRPPG